MHQLTPQQKAVVDAMSESGGSKIVTSVAGSGKTTTGVLALKAQPSSSRQVALCFARRNKEDFEGRLPPTIEARTFNSFGLQAWSRRCGKRCNTTTKKPFGIAETLGIKYDVWPNFARAMNLARELGFVPPNPPIDADPLLPWSALPSFIDHYDLHPEVPTEMDTIVELLGKALNLSITQGWQGKIDFVDQIYLPTIYEANFEPYDLVLVDEVQDVSPIQRALVHRVSNGGNILALGDPYQAIYGFRGADSDSMALFEKEFSCDPMKLTVSFRCPRAVTAEAQQYVLEMEPHASAPEGSVSDIGEDWDEYTFEEGDAILCRNNRQLVPIAFSLLRAKKPAKILGRDIGAGLKKLLKKMKSQRTTAIAQEVLEHARQECTKLESRNRKGQAANYRDRCESLAAICDGVGDGPRANLTKAIDSLFDNRRAPITLSTIHKAKGLEWPRVFFLDRSLIPSKYARTEEELRQESNIAYVAITRAQRDLIYIDSQTSG